MSGKPDYGRPGPEDAEYQLFVCGPHLTAEREHRREAQADRNSLTSQNLYWWLRAACYHIVPGVIRFYNTKSLTRLVDDQGLTVVEYKGEPGRVSVLARS